MASQCTLDFDVASAKMQRAASRRRHLVVKKEQYQRFKNGGGRQTSRSCSSEPADRAKPHRAARVAARSL
eukprot:CAMPEP_0183574482 /NCGR_PEP_ID=MMETSP0371-20130417/133474_1 /TAXON_ID=268820 /ORGANISM="Peridinium aciculiferum, Strain PAER-2" /LENGTH=69 /DNA_ID=CAMNT_0025784555 /DNA_START=97 /DNA_END=303 /DNA_ORIENTATION=-